MNLILLFDLDFITPTRVRLTGRRHAHIRDILKAEIGQSLTVGQMNGLMGQGVLALKEADAVELELVLNQKPPQALPLTLVLALPRPPMFKRILFSVAMLGVKKIIVLNFSRVEKSLWNSSSLQPSVIQEQLVLGLEQAKDTVMPEVIFKKVFKPFVQDELPSLIKGTMPLVAHPHEPQEPLSFPHALSGNSNQPITLIIGPEGGITEYEFQRLKSIGCHPIDLGPRILRTESVLPYVVGKLF